MRTIRALPLVLAIVLPDPAAAQASRGDFPLRFNSERLINPADAGVGDPISTALMPDGGLVIADIANQQVVRLDGGGELVWKLGRAGGGPGEFTTVYRLAAVRDGGVLVYDASTREVTFISPEGRYLERRRFPFNFNVVDNLVALPSGDIAVSGFTSFGGAASRHAVHIFSPQMEHIRSFGPLPDVGDPEVLRWWGAGGLSLDEHGDLLYTRRLPYEIYRFTSDGHLRGVIRPPFPIRDRPDDAYEVRAGGGRVGVQLPDAPVTRPLRAIPVGGGWVLSGRLRGSERILDLFDAAGQLAGSRTPPSNWTSVVAIDHARGVAWLSGEVQFEPVYYVVRFTVEEAVHY